MKYWLTREQLQELSHAENGNQIFVLCHKIAKEQKLETARKESLNKGLAQTLKDFEDYAEGKEVKLQNAPLTKNQYNNFQKLQYHGLAINSHTGYWKTTEAGHLFINGQPMSKYVIVDNGVTIERSPAKVTIHSLLKTQPIHDFSQRYDYLTR